MGEKIEAMNIKNIVGVEEQSQRSVVKKVASVRLAWSGTFARGTHATKIICMARSAKARLCHAKRS